MIYCSDYIKKQFPYAQAVGRFDGQINPFSNEKYRCDSKGNISMSQANYYYKDNKPMIQNMVSTCTLKCELDLHRVASLAKNTQYNSKRFAAAIMKLRNPKATALVFKSGKLVITGTKSDHYCKIAAKKFARSIKKNGL